MSEPTEKLAQDIRIIDGNHDMGAGVLAEKLVELGYLPVEEVPINNSFSQIDIPDCIFQSNEAKASGFTKRSFLEAGWRKLSQGKKLYRRKE